MKLTDASDASSLQAQAFDQIARMLISGQLPWGGRISEEDLSKHIGMSRTPVREALQTMTKLGLFQRVPRYGTIVCRPDPNLIRDHYEVRIALERHAIKCAIPRMNSSTLEHIGNQCSRIRTLADQLRKSGRTQLSLTEIDELFAADVDFHVTIVTASQNNVLTNYVKDVVLLIKIFTSPRENTFDLKHISNIHSYHHRILQAIERRDTTKAQEVLERHIRLSMTDALKALEAKLSYS